MKINSKRNIWGTWDIETKKNCQVDCPTYNCLKHTNIIDKWSIKLNNGEFYQGEQRKELISLFENFSKKKTKTFTLYAHNGGKYDDLFIINPLFKLLNKEERKSFKMIKTYNVFQKVIWRNIKFLDSCLLLRENLFNLMNDEEKKIKNLVYFTDEIIKGERVYNWKLAKNYNLKNEEEILSFYNRNDTEALYRILEEVFNKFPVAFGRATIQNLAFYLFKKENPQQMNKLKNLNHPSRDQVRRFIRRGYFGALQGNYQERKYTGTSYKYDANSFFAHLQRTKEFPYGLPKFTQAVWENDFDVRDGIGYIEVEFENLKIKEGFLPILPVEEEERKYEFSYAKTYWNILPSPLLEYALKAYTYTKIKVLKKCLFPKVEIGFFKDFVDKYGGEKERLAEEIINGKTTNQNRLYYTMLKGILVNSYGKLGQHAFKETYKLTSSKKSNLTIPAYWDKNGNSWEIKPAGIKRIRGFNAVGTSGFITAYARLEMAKIAQEIGLENVLGIKEDAIVTKTPLPQKYLHPFKIGFFKTEGIEDYFISHSAKAYQFGILKRMKGIRLADAQKLDFELLEKENQTVLTSTSKRTAEGVIIFQEEKNIQPSSKNQREKLVNGKWAPRKFLKDWDYWTKYKERIWKEINI